MKRCSNSSRGLYEAELNLGILLIDEKQFEKAVVQLKPAVEKKPGEFRPNYYLAEALLEKGDAAAAELSYKAAASANPKEAAAVIGLGPCHQPAGTARRGGPVFDSWCRIGTKVPRRSLGIGFVVRAVQAAV